MATQELRTLNDDEWLLMGTGPDLTIATQDTRDFFAVIAPAKPTIDLPTKGCFRGSSQKDVVYVNIGATDQVWARSEVDTVAVSVVKT